MIVALILALRIPGWTSGKYEIKGAEGLETSVRDGYLYISGFDSDREIRLMFDISPRVVVSDPRVNEDNLRAAVMRGPFVYCAEEADNGKGLRSIRLKRPFEIRQSVTDEFGIDAVRLDISAVRVSATGGEAFASRLYKTFDRMSESETDLKLIPYFLWSNRGEGEMSVFFGY